MNSIFDQWTHTWISEQNMLLGQLGVPCSSLNHKYQWPHTRLFMRHRRPRIQSIPTVPRKVRAIPLQKQSLFRRAIISPQHLRFHEKVIVIWLLSTSWFRITLSLLALLFEHRTVFLGWFSAGISFIKIVSWKQSIHIGYRSSSNRL